MVIRRQKLCGRKDVDPDPDPTRWVHMCSGRVCGGARWWVASYLDLRRGQPTDREMMSHTVVGREERGSGSDRVGGCTCAESGCVVVHGGWWRHILVCAERMLLVGKRRPATSGF